MGYALDKCPTVHLCCLSVPLRVGVLVIALIGLVWSALLLFAFTSAGAEWLQRAGEPQRVGTALRYVRGVLGVLACAAHLLLLLAAVYENDSLCEVYVWFMVLFCIALVVVSAVAAVAAVLDEKNMFAGVSLVLTLLAVLASFYFAVVVANYRTTLP